MGRRAVRDQLRHCCKLDPVASVCGGDLIISGVACVGGVQVEAVGVQVEGGGSQVAGGGLEVAGGGLEVAGGLGGVQEEGRVTSVFDFQGEG